MTGIKNNTNFELLNFPSLNSLSALNIHHIEKKHTNRPPASPQQLFFLDASMLLELPNFTKTMITTERAIVKRVKGSGGETISLPIAEKILSQLAHTNLTVRLDVVPDYFKIHFFTAKMKLLSTEYTYLPTTFEQKKIKTDTDYYYKPKIDVSAGFSVCGGFIEFLLIIAERLHSDVVHFPLLAYLQEKQIHEIYYPLLGVEIESVIQNMQLVA